LGQPSIEEQPGYLSYLLITQRDAGLILSAYIHGLSLDTAQPGMDPLPLLQRTLSWQATKVVELGTGCGIVGITLAQCFPKAEVILTDLPEAEEIARYNVSCVQSSSSKGTSTEKAPPRITYQNLDWTDTNLPTNLRQGDLDVIVVADCTYNVDTLPNLVRTLAALVKHNKDAMILLATKPRHDSERVFFELMVQKHMMVVDNLFVPMAHLGEEEESVEIYLFVDGTELW
jgi:predicted nicotinamide N-methyase